MKTKNLIYILSLIILAVSIILVVLYPNSGKFQLIAGILTIVGFSLNIAGFVINNK